MTDQEKKELESLRAKAEKDLTDDANESKTFASTITNYPRSVFICSVTTHTNYRYCVMWSHHSTGQRYQDQTSSVVITTIEP